MANNDFFGKVISSTELTVSGLRVNRPKPPKRIFNYFLQPAYDDWRQYMSNYYLYLPYVGVVGIEAEKYVNHMLSADLIFDTRTGSLKYNILCDATVLDSFTGNVRVSLPVTAASPFSASMNKVVTATETTVGTVLNAASGNVSGAVMDYVGGLTEIVKPVQKKSTGGYSPSTSIYDSLHVYLITETPEIIVDEGLKSNYGMPCNIWSSIGSHSGYLEVDDIRLRGAIPPDDKAEILNALKSGIYVV